MVAHFQSCETRDVAVIQNALNANLPPDVRILEVEKAPPEFHARFSARWRGYKYRIRGTQRAIGRSYSWYVPEKLDLDILNELARELIGDHCFKSFCHERPGEDEDYRSRIYRAEWNMDGDDTVFNIDGIRFLHGMVRLLVGTMLDIARGSVEITSIQQIIDKEDVRYAGTKAPAQGLILTAVGYHEWPHR
jgi:tRNA pseudouridine38-40 synthase